MSNDDTSGLAGGRPAPEGNFVVGKRVWGYGKKDLWGRARGNLILPPLSPHHSLLPPSPIPNSLPSELGMGDGGRKE